MKGGSETYGSSGISDDAPSDWKLSEQSWPMAFDALDGPVAIAAQLRADGHPVERGP
jgi:hypothetical protein